MEALWYKKHIKGTFKECSVYAGLVFQ